MVDIVVGGVPPIQTNQNKSDDQRRSSSKKKEKGEDRRRNRIDRRRSVRDGIVVTLSNRTERRTLTERRKG
jgi:hypothetical protein